MSPTVEPIVWPNTTQYKRALLNPELAFHDPQLRQITLEHDAMGTPASVEGQSAAVFFGQVGDEPIAVRCLKRPVAYGERRYAALRDYLSQWPDSPFPSADWQTSGIVVDGRHWPIVRMDHVPGTSLRQFITRSLPDATELEGLSRRWLELNEGLHAHSLAHSDLQQDNVRILQDGALRLIDLDAVWAPPLTQMPPKEVGHRHFQHPERLRTGHWDVGVDAFSALVIYLSLRAIAVDPALWDDYHNDENLILTDVDFENPGATALWSRLAASRDLEVRDLVALLDQFCRQTVRIQIDLATILRTRTLPGGAVYIVSGEPLTRTWWPGSEESVDGNAEVDASMNSTIRESRSGDAPAHWGSTDPLPVVDQWPYPDQKPNPSGDPKPGKRPSRESRERKILGGILVAAVCLVVLAILLSL